jgi:hypothetical protein
LDFSCCNPLRRPARSTQVGTTPGLENFNGKYWHTNLWPTPEDGDGDVDGKELIKGKKVAVIGCGSSAAQVIPAIVDDVEHLTVFMRTPPVVSPEWICLCQQYLSGLAGGSRYLLGSGDGK